MVLVGTMMVMVLMMWYALVFRHSAKPNIILQFDRIEYVYLHVVLPAGCQVVVQAHIHAHHARHRHMYAWRAAAWHAHIARSHCALLRLFGNWVSVCECRLCRLRFAAVTTHTVLKSSWESKRGLKCRHKAHIRTFRNYVWRTTWNRKKRCKAKKQQKTRNTITKISKKLLFFAALAVTVILHNCRIHTGNWQ